MCFFLFCVFLLTYFYDGDIMSIIIIIFWKRTVEKEAKLTENNKVLWFCCYYCCCCELFSIFFWFCCAFKFCFFLFFSLFLFIGTEFKLRCRRWETNKSKKNIIAMDVTKKIHFLYNVYTGIRRHTQLHIYMNWKIWRKTQTYYPVNTKSILYVYINK